MPKIAGIARASKPRQPMEEITSITISVEKGLEGDRRGAMPGAQVTLISEEAWARACAEVGKDLPWTTRRANLLVSGQDFNESKGMEVRIGDVHLRVTQETDPCSMMEAAQEGLKAALTPDWRGGARCEVLSGGTISVGDEVLVS
ncbi:MAG: MOSC domain-containing protein [Alphaproteobacteria bacterium]|nr:MAG: MOSC domain-containing protein [Alphaproteobacteria bacterium]